MTGISSSFTSVLGGSDSGLLAGNVKARETERRFAALVDGIRSGLDTDSPNTGTTSFSSAVTAQATGSILSDTRLPGDFLSSMSRENPSVIDAHSPLEGAAANSGQKGTIDRTSKLYEQALELESYFVKIMLSSMKNTVEKTPLNGKESFATGMYDDMFYDELARTVTKSAGFGLADQVYLQLSEI